MPIHKGISTALKLNNAGATKLQLCMNKPQEALKFFTLALKAVRKATSCKGGTTRGSVRGMTSLQSEVTGASRRLQLSEFVRQSRRTPSSTSSSRYRRRNGGTAQEPLAPREGHNQKESSDDSPRSIRAPQEDALNEDQQFVCFQPFFVVKKEDEQDFAAMRVNLNLAINFNTAICYHIMALRRVEIEVQKSSLHRKHIFMKKALALYHLSCQIQSDASIEIEDVHVLSILNNMGVIFSSLGKPRLAKYCFARLLTFLVLYKVLSRGTGTSLSAASRRDILEGFNGNTSSLILRDNMLAAAA